MRGRILRFIVSVFLCMVAAVLAAGFVSLAVGGGGLFIAKVCFAVMLFLTFSLTVKCYLIYEYRDLVKEVKEEERRVKEMKERRTKEAEEQKRKEYEARRPFKVPRGECFVWDGYREYYDCEGKYLNHKVTFTKIKESGYIYCDYEAYLEILLDRIGNYLYDYKDNSIRSFVPLIRECLNIIEHNIREIDLHEKCARKCGGRISHSINRYALREQNTQMVKTIEKYDREMQNIIKTMIVKPEIADQCKTTN